MECVRLKNWHFGWNENFFPPDWSWMVYTQVTDTPFGLDFWGDLKNRA